jgi:hypothetical protein
MHEREIDLNERATPTQQMPISLSIQLLPTQFCFKPLVVPATPID